MRARRAAAGLMAVAALGIAAAGCGGSDSGDSGAPAASTAATQAPLTDTATAPSGGGTSTAAPSGGSGDATAGKAVFTANCAGCHTLSDAGASGQVGPNLDDLKPDEATVKTTVTNGRGVMPSFKGTLSDQQIADVAAYVSSEAGG
ncbi:MAG: c-type cytochrome [Thermoleophilia bacterium]